MHIYTNKDAKKSVTLKKSLKIKNNPNVKWSIIFKKKLGALAFPKKRLLNLDFQYSSRLINLSQKNHRERSPRLDWEDYYTHDEINQYLLDTAAAHSTIAEAKVIGTTPEGRDIMALEITQAPSDADIIYIEAGTIQLQLTFREVAWSVRWGRWLRATFLHWLA